MFSRIPNLRIFFTFFFSQLLSFKTRYNSSIEIKKCIYFYLFPQKHTLKENKKFFAKQIQRFVDSEFVKTCHEQVIFYELVVGFGEQDTTMYRKFLTYYLFLTY